jgi:hypothetical protein
MIINTLSLELFTAHFWCDFCLQTDRQVRKKRELAFWAFFFHAALQAALAYLFAGIWYLWQLPAILLASHFFLDILKEISLRWFAPKDADGKPAASWKFWSMVLDQLAHVAVIVFLVTYLYQSRLISTDSYWTALIGREILRKSLVLLIGAILAVYVGGVLVGILVKPFLREIEGAEQTLKTESRGLQNGGKCIGQLERLLILFFILTGQPAGVGFLITAKSILRFGEIKDGRGRKEAEYIIIGTMLSFAWALAVACCTQYALQVVY